MIPVLHPCAVAGCPTLIPRGHPYCPLHARPLALGWRADAQRIRGRALQALRRHLYAAEPFCRHCGCGLTLRPHALHSMIRDHIVPLAEGGTDAPENIQPLCQRCSDVKTQAESRRGGR